MKKAIKGAIAAAGAGVLLLGGAGTLAYWTADGTADGSDITAGDLDLTAGTCSGWTYAAGSAGGGAAVTLFVPGDEITRTCTFGLQATGDNLAATIAAPATVPVRGAGTTSFSASAATTFAIASGTPTASRVLADGGTITSADDGGTITATFVVSIPPGNETTINANDTQNIVASLDDMTVSLQQADPNP